MNNSTIKIGKFLIALTATLTFGVYSSQAKIKPAQFRVIGYLLIKDIDSSTFNKDKFSKLTHINVAFINPDEAGNFKPQPQLKTFVKLAHKNHVRVLISIGGGSAPQYYTALLTDSMRSNLIANLLRFTKINKLDGIDVDLEGMRIDENYEKFITELATRLRPENKLITAAVATEYKTRYSDNALKQFDFINIMSYDKTGPWRLSNPGQHAPYDMVVADITYWNVIRGIAGAKLNVGLPFYGYGFGTNAPADISFNDIVKQYPAAENADEISVDDGAKIYYNGINTITAKTSYALQHAGGIMIWQLLHDAPGKKSLLNVIDSTIHRGSSDQGLKNLSPR